MINRHPKVMSKGPYDLGCCKVYLHRLDTGKERLHSIPPRKVAYALRANLLKELQELLKLGVIRVSNSSWASAIVLVD